MKNLLLTIAAILGITALTMAQNNCNLINSISLSVPDSNYQILGSYVGCVNENNPPNNGPTSINEPIASDVWSQITLTKSSANQCNLYLNGNLYFTGNYANITYIWNNLIMGAGLGTQYYGFFKGYMDEVRLSNISRTASEIAANYQNNSPFTQDANTIGLWHFDQTQGNSVAPVIGASGTITNAAWDQGYFDNGLYLNGTNAFVRFNMAVPTSAFTIEAWVKPEGLQGGVLFTPYGINNADFGLNPYTETTEYIWSTGETGNNITINPITAPYVWVNNGNCADTIWFNSQSANIYDTTYITITDTLLINSTIMAVNPPNNNNTIKVFPNPTNDHITIDYGNFAIMNGYQLRIENSLGQQLFQTNIIQQTDYLSLNNWGGNGLYFVHIIDPQGNTIDIRKIVLQ